MKREIVPQTLGLLAVIAASMMAVSSPPAAADARKPGSHDAKAQAAPSQQTQPTAAHHTSLQMPRLQEKRTVTVTGNEDWDALRGFGNDSPQVAMMILMMVGGSGMEHMKMGSMKSGKAGMANPAKSGAGVMEQNGTQPSGWKVILGPTAKALKVGKNTLDFTLLDSGARPLTGAKITIAVGMTNMDMGTAHPAVQEGKDGQYTTQVEFSMTGPWRVVLTIAPPNQKPFTQSFDFQVSP